MAARQDTERRTWRPKSKLSSEVQLHIRGLLFSVDMELLTNKSSRVAKLLKRSPREDLSLLLYDIPANQETLDLVARFCHGFDINLLTTNVIRVACVADYLGMTETQCPNNLLQTTKIFFEQHVMPCWNNSIKALKGVENILQEAIKTGLVHYCLESLIVKVIDDPCLLGEPIRTTFVSDEDSDDENDNNAYRLNARRKLFDLGWKSEDLTSLSLTIYAPVMQEMIRRQVPQEYVAVNVCQYAKKWLFEKGGGDDELSVYTNKCQKELVEVLEQLLPHQKGVVPCTFLFEMLKYAILLGVSTECRNELEVRIGRDMDNASAKDLLIPTQGYAKDEPYDIECVRRILKNFYANYIGQDVSGLYLVADLIDEFLAEISADIDLKTRTFIAVADMSVAASKGTHRNCDGLYRALDIYLDKHRHLTEMEREELCGVLDCSKLSSEAREHAALNQMLPMRIVIQVLFFGQLRLRDAIAKEGPQGFELGLPKMEGDEGEGGRMASGSEEEVRAEMEKMGSKVLELERECDVMRGQIREGGGAKREKRSLWGQMKRKLGCVTSVHDRDCHVKKKKVHPR